MRSLVAGIILGAIIATIWAGLNRPKPTPPGRNSKTLSADFREPLKGTG